MAALTQNLTAVIDPIVHLADAFEAVIQKVVECAQAYEVSKQKSLPFYIPVSALLTMPLRGDCVDALKLQSAKEACRKSSITEKQFFKLYDKIAPSILRTMYKGLLTDYFAGFKDLPQRFAQTAFELHMLTPCGNDPSPKLLRTIDEDNLRRFAWVQGHLKTAFIEALKKEAEKHHGGPETLQEKHMGTRSSAPFLNQIFNKMPAKKAMNLANLIEMAGYDLEDPEIIRSALFEPK